MRELKTPRARAFLRFPVELRWLGLLLATTIACSGTEPPAVATTKPEASSFEVLEPAAPVAEFPPAMPSTALELDTTITKVAFGSCYVPQFERSKIWRTIAATHPDLFLFLGDNVYQSEENGRPELLELREAYTALANDRDFAALRETTPVIPVWDDHDYGLNDAGGDFAAKWQSEALFEAVWAVPASDPRRSRPGVHVQYVLGSPGRRLQVIVLDTRFFRGPRIDTSETGTGSSSSMLGDQQWAWLSAALARPAELRLLVSSIPVLSERAAGESWRGWPQERERLLAMLARSPGTTVILSGDTHFASLYGSPDKWLEVGASSLNFPLPEKAQASNDFTDPARTGEPYFEANFGMLEIDWATKQATLQIRSETGLEVLSQTFELR